MAGKEDPARNFGAVGGGSAPAEKMEAEAEAEAQGIKIGVVPSAFMPQPLPPSRHKRGEKKSDLVYGGLRPCSGSHTPTEEKGKGKGKWKKADLVHGGPGPLAGVHTPMEEADVKADWVSGGLMACTGGHLLAEGNEQEEVVTGGERKANDSDGESAGHFSNGAKGAADAAKEDASADVDDGAEEEWVEMPEHYLRWILSQTRETDPVPSLNDYSLQRRADPKELASLTQLIDRFQFLQDEFFEFQAFVREAFERNGCVMVPSSFAGPQDQLKEEMKELWDKLMKEYDDTESAANEDTAVAPPTN